MVLFSPSTTSNGTPRFALLAGGGHLPRALLEGARAQGYQNHLITFMGQPQPKDLPDDLYQTSQSFSLGAVGAIIKHLKKLGITHVALGGYLSKPSFFSLKPDAKGLALLAQAARVNHHDNTLLSLVTDLLAAEGFTVLSTADLSPSLLAPAGVLGKVHPTADDHADIQLALIALAALGRLDIGQAAIVHRQTILGLEAVEGTNALITRCAELRGEGATNKQKQGLLVKVAKPGQTKLADLPTVGVHTIEHLVQHHYRGLVIQAGLTLVLGLDDVLKQANKHGLLVYAVNIDWEKIPTQL